MEPGEGHTRRELHTCRAQNLGVGREGHLGRSIKQHRLVRAGFPRKSAVPPYRTWPYRETRRPSPTHRCGRPGPGYTGVRTVKMAH